MQFTKDQLTVKIYSDTAGMSIAAAKEVSERMRALLNTQETINMLFAAAPSQSEFFNRLIRCQGIAWERVNAFHLDEYIGLSENAPQRFGNFLQRELFGHLHFRQVFYLNGKSSAENECARYADLLNRHPSDIACVGIGENGHIAFNDPHVADFNDPSAVKVVELDPVCRQQQVNDNCFGRLDEVPTHAFTLTIPAILRAAHLFCIVPYRSKAGAVFRTLHEAIGESCPASVLRTKARAVLFLDGESSSLLPDVSTPARSG